MLAGIYVRILAMLALSLVTVLSPSIGLAEHGGDRFIVDAGLKTWFANWQAPLLFDGGTGDTLQLKASQIMVGPTITAALKTSDSPWFNHLFMNFTYLTNGGKFDFDYSKLNAGITPFDSIKANRSDLNLVLGTNVYRGLGAFMGYFNSSQTVTFVELTNPTVNRNTTTSSVDRTIDAFVFGLSASGDLSDNLDFRGNISGAAGSLKYANLNNEANPLVGWSTEVGLKLHGHLTPKFEPYVYFGFRVQDYRSSYNHTETATIAGVTASRTQTLSYEDLTYGPIFQIGGQF